MAGVPDREDLIAWIRENPKHVGKREIARAFGIKGADRVELKRLLIELQDAGEIERHRRKVRPADALPPVTVLEVTKIDEDGELVAEPTHWDGDGPTPQAIVVPRKRDALGPGDLVLAKLRPLPGIERLYEARPIKKIERNERRMLGIFRAGNSGGRIEPVEKKASREWMVPHGETGGAKDGELVEAIGLESPRGPRLGLPRGRIIARHGDPTAPNQISLIAMVRYEIPLEFPADALAEAAAAEPVAGLGKREDLRELPLITIDPSDARDHDDAVFAMADDDPANPDGHIVWVAIADVAHYVRPGGALDDAARERGNSTYFPDRVSPMLPEELSADLCSLIEGVDRPCLAVRIVLDAHGNKRTHRFTRGLMRSTASLAYEDVQAAIDGRPGAVPEGLTEQVLRPLYDAYAAVGQERRRRQPLDVDLPEREIKLSVDGKVTEITYRDRLDAHRLIEEFMILANVCAAETLEAQRSPLLYRVHEEPEPERLDALRETVEAIGLHLAKGQVLRTNHLNRLLAEARGSDAAEMVAMSVLRAQQQAYYAPENYGHFGLNLRRYAHFTSPIRRYADLVVHRALIGGLGLGPDGLTAAEIKHLGETAEHISQTERRSMEAERDTVDRYAAAFMADRVGGEFEGMIAGISRAGVFVRLDGSGADGLIPISTLGSDYFRYDRSSQTLTGEQTGRVLGLGLRTTVRLVEVSPLSGGMILELLSVDGADLRRDGLGRGRNGGRRKLPGSRLKRAKGTRRRNRGR